MDLLAGLLSLQDLLDKERLRKFAETLPTPQQNIDTLRQGATSAINKLVGGFNRMADQATQQGAGVRDQLLQRYNTAMNPPQAPGPMDPTALARFEQLQREQLMQAAQQMKSAQPAAPTLLGVLPDGTRVSKEEERAYWDNLQKQFTRDVIEGREKKPAPTRAPMRNKLAAQGERDKNVNAPIVSPPKAQWDWPQVYKDIMRGQPQMEWTKGMTPREPELPQGLLGSNQSASGPLEVSVTKRVAGPRDVYIGDNPVHTTQTLVADYPQYEGQEVAIPDTPSDRMSQYHVGQVIIPIQNLTWDENYKAKSGLEDYTPPKSAAGQSFPTQADVDFYRSVDATYGTPEAGYLQPGARGSYYADPIKMADRQGGVRRPLTPGDLDATYAAYMAAQRNPVSALGFQPDKFDYSSNPYPLTTGGQTFPVADRMFVDPKFPSVLVHEPFHYGHELVAMDDYKNRGGESEGIFPVGNGDQENYVRGMMQEQFGPVKQYELARQQVDPSYTAELDQNADGFLAANEARRRLLEDKALQLYMRRRRKMGPN